MFPLEKPVGSCRLRGSRLVRRRGMARLVGKGTRSGMTRRSTFLVFGEPMIAEDEIAEVVRCLRSGWIGTGPRVAAFEEGFRSYKGADYAVAVNSCTAAL